MRVLWQLRGEGHLGDQLRQRRFPLIDIPNRELPIRGPSDIIEAAVFVPTAGRSLRVYFASKVKYAPLWQGMRAALVAAGVDVQSPWIDSPINLAGANPPSADNWSRHWAECLEHAAGAFFTQRKMRDSAGRSVNWARVSPLVNARLLSRIIGGRLATIPAAESFQLSRQRLVAQARGERERVSGAVIVMLKNSVRRPAKLPLTV